MDALLRTRTFDRYLPNLISLDYSQEIHFRENEEWDKSGKKPIQKFFIETITFHGQPGFYTEILHYLSKIYTSAWLQQEKKEEYSFTGYHPFLEITSVVSFFSLLFNVLENLNGSLKTFSEGTQSTVSKQGKPHSTTDMS